jgi:uncharacterized membrane protein YhaH (DUF805 family)
MYRGMVRELRLTLLPSSTQSSWRPHLAWSVQSIPILNLLPTLWANASIADHPCRRRRRRRRRGRGSYWMCLVVVVAAIGCVGPMEGRQFVVNFWLVAISSTNATQQCRGKLLWRSPPPPQPNSAHADHSLTCPMQVCGG